MMKTLQDYIQAGKLTEGLEFLKKQIKANPKDLQLRGLLVELLCIQRDYERADQQIETLIMQNPKFAISGKQLRQLIRAAKHREDVLLNGALPQWITKPDALINQQMKVLTSTLSGKYVDAGKGIKKLNQALSDQKGSVNDEDTFQGIRDLDDRTAFVIELLALNGEYYWVPFSAIKSITFESSRELISLIWKPVLVTFAAGMEQNFYFPATYVDPRATEEELLGHTTEWNEVKGFSTGRGQRVFLMGDEAIAVSEIKQLQLG